MWIEIIDEYDQVISFGKKCDIQGNVIKPLLLTNFVGGGSTPLIKRSCIDTVGNYDLTFKERKCQGAEDWEFYLRIAGDFQFKLVPSFLTRYRMTKDSMSSNQEKMIRSIELANEYTMRRYYRLYPGLFRKKQSRISLLKTSYSNICGDYATSMKFIFRAILQDPIEIVNPQVLKLITKNFLKISDQKKNRVSDIESYKVCMGKMEFFYHRLVNRQLSKLGVVVK